MFTAMIVDDYEIFRKELQSMPVWGKESGFVVTEEAANGREALYKLQKNPVDLLLTDIRMPMVDGLELINKATEQALCGCIIIMSQFSDFEYARKGLSSGALDYLLKPVDREALLKVLIRAAACINEKRQATSRISYLEKMLNQGNREFFPNDELDRLTALISEGKREASDAASYLADVTSTELLFDTIKTAQVLNKAFNKLIEATEAEFPWIKKFLSPQEQKLGDNLRYSDTAALKEAFVGKVDAVLLTIRKYELDIDNDSIVRMACRTILENIDTDITVNELSGKLFITRTYLSQIFKEKTGITLVKYLTDVKIERAKVMISGGSKNFEIAEKLGYNDDEYFRKLFKKATGMTINEYKSSL